MQCNNIWKLDGDCAGEVLWYKVVDPNGAIYDEETLAPFERSGFSIKGGVEFREHELGVITRLGVITTLCDKHRAILADLHNGWRINETHDPLAA